MTTRRGFIASLLAASAAPALSWADAGSPAFLAAARDADGSFALYGLGAEGGDRFRVELPARAHAGAVHPARPEAVVFARRPGHYALVLDCVAGAVLARLAPPEGRLFQGHGCFSADGTVLFTSEAEYETSAGRIGLWRRRDWTRIGEIASGGIGPHEIARLPGGDTLVVANGGIHTTPDTDRDKLNLDTMRPNLAYFGPEGGIAELVELEPALRRNSIRHLAPGRGGTVAFAMQWEGDPGEAVPLLGLHRPGGSLVLAAAPEAEQRAMQGYAGSVAMTGDGGLIAISSPRGGRLHLFDGAGGFVSALPRADVCGLAALPEGLVATDGMGGILAVTPERLTPLARAARAWDNHAVALG